MAIKKKVKMTSFQKAQDAVNQDFMTTPDQPAMDAQAGGNAAADAANASLPERKSLAASTIKFKNAAEEEAYNAMSPEDKKKFEEDYANRTNPDYMAPGNYKRTPERIVRKVTTGL